MTVRLRRQRQFRLIRQASGVAVVLLAAVGAITWYAMPPDGPVEKATPVVPATTVSRVTCRDVHQEMKSLLAGDIAPERAAAIQRHLDRCPPCQHYADRMKAEQGLSLDEFHPPVELVHVVDLEAALAYGFAQP